MCLKVKLKDASFFFQNKRHLKNHTRKESRINVSKPNARSLCLHRCLFILHESIFFCLSAYFSSVQFVSVKSPYFLSALGIYILFLGFY